MSDAIARLRAVISAGRDGALARYALGQALAQAGDAAAAAAEFRRALEFDPRYSAAWKALGQALMAVGDAAGAAEGYRHGIAVATARGDTQAAREMGVFLRRIERSGATGA